MSLPAQTTDRTTTPMLPPSGVSAFKFDEILPASGNKSKHPLPLPRSGHRIVCDDANVYSFGGYSEKVEQNGIGTGTHHLFHELWKLNLATNEWELLQPAGRTPNELASHSAILSGKNLIIFGGTGVPFGVSSSNQMHICNLELMRWSQVCTRGPAPTPAYGQACLLKENSFYVVGGTTGYTFSMDVHKLDMSTWTWEALFISQGDASEPEPRYRHEIAMKDNHIYVLGGGTASKAFNMVVIPVFDVTERKWMSLTTKAAETGKYPDDRKCHGIAVVEDDIFVFGGFDSTSILVDIWKLNINTLSWTLLSITMPIPVYFHSCAITPAGCMYMFGGITDIKQNTRTNQAFKIWLKVPTLKDMAWEIITKSNPNLSKHTKTELLAAGIPAMYASRLHDEPEESAMKNRMKTICTDTDPASKTSEPYKCKNNCIGPQFT